MATIKWLHISDLHLNKTGVENIRLREKLPLYLKGLINECDYVFCTGDLRHALAGEYAVNTLEVLKAICDAVSVPLYHLFITPGNHDVDLKIPNRDDAINAVLKEYASTFGMISPDHLQKIISGTDGYRAILEKVFDERVNHIGNSLSYFGPHTLIRTDKINVIEMDSTLSFSTNHSSDLIIGTSYLQQALGKCDNTKEIIVITHYSFDYMCREGQEIITALMKDYNVHLWLSGHEHKNLFRKQRDWFYEFQCGNLLLENGARACILIGELDTERRQGVVRAHAWFSPDGWSLYPFVNSGANDPSAYFFNLSPCGSELSSGIKLRKNALRDMVMPLLNENHVLYDEYGPTDFNRNTIRSELAASWHQIIIEKVIPNSLKVIALLEEHMDILSSDERNILSRYKAHIVGLRQNHCDGETFKLNAPHFPEAIFSILS